MCPFSVMHLLRMARRVAETCSGILCLLYCTFTLLCASFGFSYSIEHSVCLIKTSQLILYMEIIAVCSEIHTKHINTLCGQNAKFPDIKPGGTNSDHWALKD